MPKIESGGREFGSGTNRKNDSQRDTSASSLIGNEKVI